VIKPGKPVIGRAPPRMQIRQAKGPPPGNADAAAREARDHAHPKPFTSPKPALSLAGSWQDLVKDVSFQPSPPRFGQAATVKFQLTERAVSVPLGDKSFLIAVSGNASATATLSLSNPDPPLLHRWKCNKCPQEFTIDPTRQACVRGRPPVPHEFACANGWTDRWTDLQGVHSEDKTCNAGIGFPPTCSHGHLLHNYKCKHDRCGHKRLTDLISISADNRDWMDRVSQLFCDPGTPDTPHSWRCTRCDVGMSGALQQAVCPRAPGTPPTVTGTFGATAQVAVDLNAVAARLYVDLGPREILAVIPRLPQLVADAYQGALAGVLGQLQGRFPVEEVFRETFEHACGNALAPLTAKFGAATLPAFSGLRDTVIRFAQQHLTALDELFPDLVEVLTLVGDDRAVIDQAGQVLADALRRASASELPSLWSLANWLLGFCAGTLPAAAEALATRLILATRDTFVQQRGQVDVFLEDQLVRIAGQGGDAVSFARGVLSAVRDAAGDLGGAADFLVGVAVCLSPGNAGPAFAGALGSLVGLLGAAALRAGKDVGVILGPLSDELARAHKLTADEVKLLASHLGDDTLFKKALTWMRDNWARFQLLVKEGAAELKKWLDYILDLVAKVGHPPGFAEQDRLVGLLKWLQGLPNALLHPEALGDVNGQLAKLGQVLGGGLISWLDEKAAEANTTKGQFFKDFVTKHNVLMKNAKDIRAALLPILGQVEHAGKMTAQAVDSYAKAVTELQDWEKRLWSFVFADGAGVGPLIAQVGLHALSNDPLQASGAQVEISEPTAFVDALQQGEQVVAALGAAAVADASFLSFEVLREKLKVPHPTDTRPFSLPKGGAVIPPIPLSIPVPWNAGVALCHLPEFYAIDMRYHFPYGDIGCYHVADLDKDGFVRPWEVKKVREAVVKSKTQDFYDFALDCDGDGQITEDDLQLAVEQQQNFVNGLMYRPATSPLGFFVALAPTMWAFATFTDLTDESTLGGVTRRGILLLADGQLAIPMPPIFGDGRNYYPIRFHFENRLFVDKFDNLAPSLGGEQPLIAPLTASERVDMILRGGKTGRDWQVYFTCEPMNPVLLTWNLRGTLYLRGVGAAGAGIGAGASVAAAVGGKGAGFIHFDYESSAPLIEVIEEWADRLRGISETKAGDLPVPWAMIKGILEWTDVPRLARALIQIAGPMMDLLFDWCDEGHHIRGALGYIRQVVLNNWQPAPTWEQLRKELEGWDDVLYAERQEILRVVTDVQIGGDEDPVYVPALLAQRLRKVAPSAEARIKKTFEEDRARFAASLDQLVPEGIGHEPYAKTVSIPRCGSFKVTNPFIAAFPIRWDDLKNNAHPGESTLDEILAVRGNPFYKPIYHTAVEFGPEAKLFTCPNQDLGYFVGSIAGQKGLVEGSRVLEDGAGNRWLWVRTDSWHHGWVFLDADVCAELFSVKEAAEVAGKDIAGDLLKEVLGQAADLGLPVSVLGPGGVDKINRGMGDLIDKLAGKGTRPTVTKIEASARCTVDESRHVRVCRAALARRRAGRRAPGDDDIYKVFNDALQEFDMRMNGAIPDAESLLNPPPLDVLDKIGAKISTTFNGLSMPKREKLWAAGTSWLKILEYSPKIIVTVIEALVPPILDGKFAEAWEVILGMLRKTAGVQLEDLLVAAQSSAPAIKEVILTMIDMGIKLKSVKDSVTTGEMNVAGSGQVGPAGGGGDEVTFKEVGVKILRLLIDDEEEPGRPSKPRRERRGRKSHDTGISFSFEVSAKVTEEKATDEAAPKKKNERTIALAEPYIARIGVLREGEEPVIGTNSTVGENPPAVDAPDDTPGDEPAEVSSDPPAEEGEVFGSAATAPAWSDGGGEVSGGEDTFDDEEPVGEVGGGDAAAEDSEQVSWPAVGEKLQLLVIEWGAITFTDPVKWSDRVDSWRIPKELRASVGWEVSIDGGDYADVRDEAGEALRGDPVTFTVTEEHHEKVLTFRAFTRPIDWKTVAATSEDASE
jgi:hypothetical protein